MNVCHLRPLRRRRSLLRQQSRLFRQEIGEVRTTATVLGLLAIAQAWIADQKIAAGGSDVPTPMHVIIAPQPARMTGIGAVEPAASDQPGRSDLPATAELLSIP